MRLVSFERRRDGAFPGARGKVRSAGVEPARSTPEISEDAAPCAHRLGALIADGPRAGDVVDLNRALAVKLAMEDSPLPEAEADSVLPSDLLACLRHGAASIEAAARALDFALASLARFDGPDPQQTGMILPRRSVRLLAPVPRPGKIVCVARNYASHAKEMAPEPAPQEPSLFLKAPSAVIGPEDTIVLPRVSEQVDYEGELVAILGRSAREVSEAEALGCVAGYCAGNDVSARDWQGVRGQRFIGKSCDGFAPMGPALVTADEIPDPQNLAIRTIVSGETMQSARTSEMTFSVATLISFVSRLMTLEPGDAIFTGTPAGVGAGRTPPRWLRDGDVVEIEIERVGRLVSYVSGRRESA